MIKDEFSLTEVIYTIDERAFQGMTISISTAPFYGAPPPDMDMTFEVLITRTKPKSLGFTFRPPMILVPRVETR